MPEENLPLQAIINVVGAKDKNAAGEVARQFQSNFTRENKGVIAKTLGDNKVGFFGTSEQSEYMMAKFDATRPKIDRRNFYDKLEITLVVNSTLPQTMHLVDMIGTYATLQEQAHVDREAARKDRQDTQNHQIEMLQELEDREQKCRNWSKSLEQRESDLETQIETEKKARLAIVEQKEAALDNKKKAFHEEQEQTYAQSGNKSGRKTPSKSELKRLRRELAQATTNVKDLEQRLEDTEAERTELQLFIDQQSGKKQVQKVQKKYVALKSTAEDAIVAYMLQSIENIRADAEQFAKRGSHNIRQQLEELHASAGLLANGRSLVDIATELSENPTQTLERAYDTAHVADHINYEKAQLKVNEIQIALNEIKQSADEVLSKPSRLTDIFQRAIEKERKTLEKKLEREKAKVSSYEVKRNEAVEADVERVSHMGSDLEQGLGTDKTIPVLLSVQPSEDHYEMRVYLPITQRDDKSSKKNGLKEISDTIIGHVVFGDDQNWYEDMSGKAKVSSNGIVYYTLSIPRDESIRVNPCEDMSRALHSKFGTSSAAEYGFNLEVITINAQNEKPQSIPNNNGEVNMFQQYQINKQAVIDVVTSIDPSNPLKKSDVHDLVTHHGVDMSSAQLGRLLCELSSDEIIQSTGNRGGKKYHG